MGVVATLAVRVTANTGDFEKNLGKLEGQWKRTGAKLQSIGSSLTASVTVPLLAISAAALKVSMDFETAMTKTITLAGETKASMEGLKGSVLALSKETGVGPVALANALVAIESNGLTGSAAMDVLAASAKGSAIGMGEAADIGRALTAVVNAYGTNTISATQAADQFHQVVLLGGAEASTLAGELGRVVGVAANLGVSFAETGAFIATYTRLGLSASEATTALSGVLNTILNPSAEARKALADIGMSAEGLRRQVSEEGLGATLTSLIGKLHGNADATGMLFGNVRALAGVMGTAGVQAQQYKDNLDKILHSTGSLDAAFKVWEGTTAATWSKFTAGAQAALVVIGDQLAPAFSRVLQSAMPVLDAVVQLVNWFSQLPQPVQTTVIGMTALAAAAGPVAYAFGSLFTAGSSVLGLLKMIPGATAVAGSGWALLSNPITGVVAAIAAVLYALKQLTGSWTSAFTILMPPVGFLMRAWDSVADKIRYVKALLPGGDEMPAAPGAPASKVNAPLGPAMDINQALSLLDDTGRRATNMYEGLGRAGVGAMKGIKAATQDVLESTRILGNNYAAGAYPGAYTGVTMGGGGNLGGMMAQLGTLPSGSRIQDIANQAGMSGAPSVQSQNIAAAVSAYAAEQMADSAKETVDGIRKAFQYFTGSLSSGMSALLGGVMNILEKGAAKGGFLQKLLGGKAGQMIGTGLDIGMASFGGGFGMGESFGKGKGALGGAATGALTGAMIAGPFGAAIGGLAGLIGGLFGGAKKKREEQAKMGQTREQLVSDFGGMANLKKQAQLAGVSVDLLFSTTKPKVFQAELEKVDDAIKAMQDRIKGTITEIDKVMSGGGLIGADLWGKILKDGSADEIKAKMEEVFTASVNKAAEGFNQIGQNFELLNAPIEQVGVLADAAFAGMLADGASLPEALAAIAPALDHIQEILTKTGQTATGPLAAMLAWQGIIEQNKGVFEILSGVDAMLTGLGNSGLLTQARFTALGQTITQAFGNLQAHGVAAGTALELMQPQLQKLWEAQQMFHLQTDAATQSLINQAVQQGLVGEQMKDVNHQILDVLTAIAKALGADIPAAMQTMTGAAGAAAAAIPPKFQIIADGVKGVLSGIPRTIPIEFDMRLKGEMPVPPTEINGHEIFTAGPTTRIPAMAAGGIVSRPTTILAGEAGPEAIVPLNEYMQGSGVNVNITVNGTADRAFAHVLAREISLGGDVKTAWRGALR